MFCAVFEALFEKLKAPITELETTFHKIKTKQKATENMTLIFNSVFIAIPFNNRVRKIHHNLVLKRHIRGQSRAAYLKLKIRVTFNVAFTLTSYNECQAVKNLYLKYIMGSLTLLGGLLIIPQHLFNSDKIALVAKPGGLFFFLE